MILSCPSCAKRFMLDGRLLGAGRKVKCGQCGNIWFAEPNMAVAPPPPRRPAPQPQPAPRPAAPARPAAAARAPMATVERPGAGGGTPPSRPAARNSVSPPPPPPPPMEEVRGTLFDDPPGDDLGGFGDLAGGLADDGFDQKRFDADADDMGLSRSFRPRPLPKGSNLPAIPGQSKARRAAIVAWTGLALVVGGIGAGIFYGKDMALQAWPASFALYELLGLAELPGTGLSEPNDPKTTKVEIRDIEGINMLFVTGEIANRSDTQRDVPDIQAVAIGEDGRELYAWRIIPPVRRLFPNQSTKFESRVPERDGTQAKNIRLSYVAPEGAAAH